MLNAKSLGFALLLCGLCYSNAEAKLFKWVDDKGITHYGETIPPEYANRDATQLGKQGQVEKVIEVLTPEERRVKREEDEKERLARQAETETRRRDSALLSTFSNEKEIDLARDRSLQQVEAKLNAVKTMLGSAQQTLAEHKKEQAGLSRNNKKIPAALAEELVADEVRVNQLQNEQVQNEQELDAIKARFESDKKRFRELKGIAPAEPATKQ